MTPDCTEEALRAAQFQRAREEAESPATSPERLRELARLPGLPFFIAANPAVPSELLDTWARSWPAVSSSGLLAPGQPWTAFFEAIAANPNASWTALLHLAHYYPRTVYDNPAFLFGFFQEGSNLDRIPGWTLERLLGLPDIPEDWLRAGATHPSHNVRAFVACDPRTPPETLVSLLDRLHLCDLVINNPSLPQEAIDGLVRDPERRLLAAHCPRIRLWQLEKLSFDQAVAVRAAVARSPRLPEGTLWRLADDREPPVRLAVAGNGASPLGILQMLWKDPDRNVREAVAHNCRMLGAALRVNDPGRKKRTDGRAKGKTPHDQLRELARPGQQWRVAGLAKAPGEVLDLLARSKVTRVRREVARNPSTWPSTLESLAGDRHHEVRLAAARHPQTPRRSLEKLVVDPIVAVRKMLLENPSLPAVLRSSLALDDSPEVRKRAQMAR